MAATSRMAHVPLWRSGCQDARVEPPNAAHPAVTGIATAVRASLEDLVSAAVQDIWDQVPAYSASNDERLREDVAIHVRAIFEVFLAGLTGRRPVRRSEFAMTREQATRRVAQGITLADFLQAFRIGQITLWHGVLAAAGDDAAARDAALTLVARIMEVIEAGSTVAAEAYVEAQQHHGGARRGPVRRPRPARRRPGSGPDPGRQPGACGRPPRRDRDDRPGAAGRGRGRGGWVAARV
jgi:hypothetical protein